MEYLLMEAVNAVGKEGDDMAVVAQLRNFVWANHGSVAHVSNDRFEDFAAGETTFPNQGWVVLLASRQRDRQKRSFGRLPRSVMDESDLLRASPSEVAGSHHAAHPHIPKERVNT